jgi:hypothetical protein
MRLAVPFAAVSLCALAACVAYRPAPVDLASAAEARGVPLPRPLSYEAAVRWALAREPSLCALRARAAAVNLDPGPEPVEVSAGVDSAHDPEAMLTLDALSLLGLGARAGDRALARARRDEAVARHHERAREVAGELAEAFEVERALAALGLPELDVNPDAYVKAGLEPRAAKTAADATKAALEAEAASRDAERRRNRVALARLLGARPDARLDLALPPTPWPPETPARGAALLAARADLQRRLSEYETADAEFLRAVAAQTPALVLEPGVGGDPVVGFGRVGLRLPLGAPREALAAQGARDAVRHELEGAVLDALAQAAGARAEAVAAGKRLAAARARLDADLDVFRAAKTRLETTGGSLVEVALAAESAAGTARDLREAAVEDARARIAAARAAGWPFAEAVR